MIDNMSDEKFKISDHKFNEYLQKLSNNHLKLVALSQTIK